MATYGYTFQSGDGVTPTRINDARTISNIVDADISASAAIAGSKLANGAVTQAKLASNVAGNGPAFRARQSSAQTLTASASARKVNLQSEDIDTASCFDSTTNYRFTPTVAGYYHITGAIRFNNSGFVVQAQLYKNGSLATAGCATDTHHSIVSDLIYFNGTTDYLELFAFHSSASSQTMTAAGFDTYMIGFLARAA